jgi:hypothetical protein
MKTTNIFTRILDEQMGHSKTHGQVLVAPARRMGPITVMEMADTVVGSTAVENVKVGSEI